MKSLIKDFFSKCDQIRRKLQIWAHVLKKSLIENLNFCAVSRHMVRCILSYLYLISKSLGFTLNVPSNSGSCIQIKIKLSFYFDTSL